MSEFLSHHKVVVEKTLESPLDGKEIKPVNPQGTDKKKQAYGYQRGKEGRDKLVVLH